jgi:putative methionine-R-sulfoxide reductase with GAF domain
MPGSAQPEERFPSASSEDNRVLAETELDSALQLLVERAQYITGATGTALALPQGDEMVCRASAGSSAPAVGARLQVRSGLTGESILRRQLLRCDNAEADPRVNLEACRALGIASIVVLPLLRRNGEVRGLFELFSDHPYAFEERDLVALERMAGLTLTALDLAEQRQNSAPAAAAIPLNPAGNMPRSIPSDITGGILSNPELAPASVVSAAAPAISPASSEPPSLTALPVPVPEAMLRVQKCAACGFPVSEGRTLCLDCEKKNSDNKKSEKKQREWDQAHILPPQAEPGPAGREHDSDLTTPVRPTPTHVRLKPRPSRPASRSQTHLPTQPPTPRRSPRNMKTNSSPPSSPTPRPRRNPGSRTMSICSRSWFSSSASSSPSSFFDNEVFR